MYAKLRSALDVVSTVLVIGAAGALLWRLFLSTPVPAGAPKPSEDVDNLRIEAALAQNVKGDGLLALVEFSDYECPFCAQHANGTERELRKLFVDTGQLRHVIFNYPLPIHPRAQKASEAAECAARQGRFWDMHDTLFATPAALQPSDLAEYSQKLALDTSAFDACLSGALTANKVHADVAEGLRLGVNSTPAFFLGRVGADGSIQLVKRINGAQPLREFTAAIDELLQADPARRAS